MVITTIRVVDIMMSLMNQLWGMAPTRVSFAPCMPYFFLTPRAMGNGTYPSLFCPMYAIFLFNTTCLHTLSFLTHQTRPSHPLSSISCMHPISIKSIVSCPCLILSHMHGSLHYPSNHPSNPFSHSKTFSYPLSFSHHLS